MPPKYASAPLQVLPYSAVNMKTVENYNILPLISLKHKQQWYPFREITTVLLTKFVPILSKQSINLETRHTSWHLTFWYRKWCRSHVWRGLPVCQIWSS